MVAGHTTPREFCSNWEYFLVWTISRIRWRRDRTDPSWPLSCCRHTPIEKEPTMSRLGSNVRLALTPAAAETAHRVFADALGATRIDPMPDLAVYQFAGGGNVGVYTMTEALTDEQQALGAWLEFLVPDVDKARALCESAGCVRFEYGKGTMTYLRGPGGLCFRLAAEG